MVVRGKWEVTAQWHEIFEGKGENFLKLTVVMVVQLCEYNKNNDLYTLNG